MEYSYTPIPSFSAESTLWPQQSSEAVAPIVTLPFSFVPQPGQHSNPLQDYDYSPNTYYENDQAVTTPLTMGPSLLNSVHENDHVPASYMSEMELSHTRLDTWLQQASTSSFDTGTQQNQNLYHDRRQSTGLAAAESLELAIPRRTINEWDGSHEESASQEDLNRS